MSALGASRMSGNEDVLIRASSIRPFIALCFGSDARGDFGALLLLPGLDMGDAMTWSAACEALL
jgi:hypothetical protein